MGGVQVPKLAVYLCGAVLVILLALAIALPIATKKKEETITVEHVIAQSVAYHDVFSAVRPIEKVSRETRQLFESLTAKQLRGQLQQWSASPFTGGDPVKQVESWIDDDRVGSLLGQADSKTILSHLEYAVEKGKSPIVYGFDVIHGFATTYPQNLGLAASFNRSLVEAVAAASAKEARAAGIRWAFSPMTDLARDPRWGRASESFGEDPLLVGEMATAFVKGLQANGVGACVKHVGGYGGALAGKDYAEVDLGNVVLMNDYLEGYRRALVDGKAMTAMASFNTLNGVPSHANGELLTDILRGMWGWDGVIVGDYDGVAELITHGVAANGPDAAVRAIEAGVDMSMADGLFWEHLGEVESVVSFRTGHSVKEHMQIAGERVFRFKEQLDLFNDPLDKDFRKGEDQMCKPEYFELAREAAQQSVILLENKDQTLPILKPESGGTKPPLEILVVGNLAHNRTDMLGSWAPAGRDWCADSDIVTYLEGIAQEDGVKVSFWPQREIVDEWGGWNMTDPRAVPNVVKVDESVLEKLDSFDYVIQIAGEHANMNGEAASRTNLALPEKDLIKKIINSVPASSLENFKKKFILFIHAGRPQTIEYEAETLSTILFGFSLGTRGGEALADILFGRVSPSAHVPMSFPRNEGQIPIFHSELRTGRPSRGNSGDEPWSPGGMMCGTTRYIDSKKSPLYPFGYGLSYFNFKISEMALGKTEVKKSETLSVNLTVEIVDPNWRKMSSAAAVVQLYVRDEVASVAPAWKKLKSFERVIFTSDGPTSRNISLQLDPQKDLGFWNREIEWIVEAGEFTIYASLGDTTDFNNMPLKKNFTLID